jgi:hypothetical protein
VSVEWTDVQADFQPDGALRDIYARPADLAAWNRALAFLASSTTLRYQVNGIEEAVPTSAAEPLSRGDLSSLLMADFGCIGLTCHFFTEDEVELSFDPTDVRDQASLDTLGTFVIGLSNATGCDVFVTPENLRERPILRYIAGRSTWEWVPSPAG